MNFLRRVGNVDQPEPIRRQLSNGLLLLAEPVPGVPSLALGAWIRSGSQHETNDMMGAAHFIEHLVFKGTRKRSAYQIAQKLEALGGQVDAFTTKETTCFHARIFAGHRRSAANILGELLSDATFPRPEVEKERQVIVEEIHAYEDTPEEFVFDLATEKIWDGHSMGHSILGRLETLKAMGTRDLQKFHRDHYTRPNMIITAAGNVDVDRLVDEIEASFRLPTRQHRNGLGPLPDFVPTTTHLDRDLQQTSICLMGRGPSATDETRHAAAILHTILGAGMSSRLFQKVREVHGLAYSVYSYMEVLRESGIFCIYMAVEPKEAKRAVRLVGRELRKVRDKGVKKWELEAAKAQLLTQLFLSYESMFERVSRLAYDEMYYGTQLPVRRMVEEIVSVTPEQIRDVADRLLRPESFALVSAGPGTVNAPSLEDLDA